ncbi:hypothetical protein [Sediminibacterium goheungense]|uniref:Uncharacterized protein n=1 Tax=Sediminibacterium goheungense TaxID=1086393 RepID=A0A4V3C4F6_9BACT|nr:hypothetical protein [Sediminibacterium goheungense]TDO25768.1 hypothetical protein BC659_2691 [Sediminibacterium goheungense]
MKKLLFVLALGAFAACNSGENKEATADTPAAAPVTVDTTAAPAADTTATADTTAAAK